ncbi:YdcF family protein [Oricola sp.]|uniref:YdcF family protein n=1 Tax=Oricola sp. TaxID=1979950 RepID=UPI003BAB4E99
MFFLISKIGWLVIQPLGLIGLCLLASAVFALTGWRIWAVAAALTGLAILVASAQTNLGRLALQPLENRFPRPSAEPAAEDVAGIIVLGGAFDGHVTRFRGGFELGEAGDRFTEAVRLAKRYGDAPVVVTGGDASLIGKTEGDASVAVRFFGSFGIDRRRLILEAHSLNTYENAQLTAAMLPEGRSGRWLLVTSAFHMPRSMGAFRLFDVAVMPWPVDFRTGGEERFSIGRDDPLDAFGELSLAMREWIGLQVYGMTGRIASTER